MSKRMVQNPPHDTGVHVRQAAHDPRQLASSVYPQHILLLCACACLWSSNALAPLQAQTSGINAEPVEQQQATPLESTEQPTMTAVPGIELEGAILKTIDATSLAAQVAGPLRELLVKEGDIVKANQALGKINDDALRLELEQLKTQITVAQKKQANDIDERLAEKSLQ
ncbi:MAG: biotin/lipoyl-binding protein, partial [Planctomycetales bacterium]|nr:biotin/lipoyl-binding protein [Planctomycetales bacterium]